MINQSDIDAFEFYNKADLTLTEYCQNAEKGMFGYFHSNNLMDRFNKFRELSAGYSYE